MKSPHVVWHPQLVTREDRERLNKHRSGVIWFTGLPASGKSTIAHFVERNLFERGIRAYVLDGDNVRHGLCADLGFSREDRRENLRRIAEVCKLMVDAGLIVLAAFVSPFREDRQYVREIIGNDCFFEVYVKCSPETCEKRDPKGLYRKARAGKIEGFTGINAPYEEPEAPDLVLDTEKHDLEECVSLVLKMLSQKKFILLI
ncbi:adenylyl-sulfate kinase [Thermosulfurimonas dismutans]|uniref:Adenylyl-sulfate kinase n=1 Tax=Thermosulfurimonas dismutans TaxID=999894 RepID=A0A179D1D7_9BACT|nr:adenylyl-sulfate kinase [Thermosulfurimonas dismutans]OAQ19860.1 Adenylylsulfate kinase [Thermosulfurimonas dismutans]